MSTISTQARDYVHRMEETKRKIHAAKDELKAAKHKRTEAEKTIEYAQQEAERLTILLTELESEAQANYRRYMEAGRSWLRIEAAEVPESERVNA